MKLHVRRWRRRGDSPPIVCLHGVGQHGGIFQDLDSRLRDTGAELVAMDLRGHGKSGKKPPWNTRTHMADVKETANALGSISKTWIAHSFGARVLVELAVNNPDLVDRLVLLEPGLQVTATAAQQRAEIERLDWNYETVDGAIRALTGFAVPEIAHAPIAEFVREDLVKGSDDRYRLSFTPSAAVVAWSEMALAPPQLDGIDGMEVLVIRAAQSQGVKQSDAQIYRECLSRSVAAVTVPNGHNVLWESPDETAAAVGRFLSSGADEQAKLSSVKPQDEEEEVIAGYEDSAGTLHLLQ